MEQTTLAFAAFRTKIFNGCPEATGFSGGPVLHKIVYPTKGLDCICGRLGIVLFLGASEHPSTKHFPVWKTFCARNKKVSTRNASAKRLSSAQRVTAAVLVQ
jgi:hypothetical protein